MIRKFRLKAYPLKEIKKENILDINPPYCRGIQNQGYFILNFSILYIYENTLLPALDNASLAICKASKFIAQI